MTTRRREQPLNTEPPRASRIAAKVSGRVRLEWRKSGWAANSKGSIRLSLNFRDSVLVSGIACASLGLAWFYEADYFAIFFAGAAAIAIFEAVRRSV
jgi:hypothetical protein